MKRSAWWGSKGDWKTDLVHTYILRCLAVAYCKIGDYAKAVEESKFARKRALEDLNDDGDCGLWRESIVRECKEIDQYCQSQTNKVGKELCALSDQYATLDLGSTAAHAESPTDEAEAMTEVEGSSTLESAGSIPDYLGRLSEKYAVLSQEDLAFNTLGRKKLKGFITVTGVPKDGGREPTNVVLVGVGDLGRWKAQRGCWLDLVGEGEWRVSAALDKDREYHGTLVAFYDDGNGQRYALVDALPLHSFFANDGQTPEADEDDWDAVDGFNITLEWQN